MKCIIAFVFLCQLSVLVWAQENVVISEFIPRVVIEEGNDLELTGGTVIDVPRNLDIFVGIKKIDLGDKRIGSVIEIRTKYRELAFKDVGENARCQVEVFLQLQSNDKKIDGVFGEKIITNVDYSKRLKIQNDDLTIRNIFELPKGKYILRVVLRDMLTGNRGSRQMRFEVL